jgi:hypothetical protein
MIPYDDDPASCSRAISQETYLEEQLELRKFKPVGLLEHLI